MHVPAPLQPPPFQPAKIEYMAGVAVRVTIGAVSERGRCRCRRRLTPDGSETTPPPPLPILMTAERVLGEREHRCGSGVRRDRAIRN